MVIQYRCPKCSGIHQAPPRLAGEAVECPICGNVNVVPSGGAQVAGASLTPGMGGAEPRCSRALYILLGIFLGGLGVHNFVAGRTKQGLGQLFTVLIAGWFLFPLIIVALWVLSDICSVTHGGAGVPMS